MNILIAALAPVIIILFYIYFRDKYEREPIGLLLMSIAAGALIVLPVIFFEQLISSKNPFLGLPEKRIGNAAYDAFLVAALLSTPVHSEKSFILIGMDGSKMKCLNISI